MRHTIHLYRAALEVSAAAMGLWAVRAIWADGGFAWMPLNLVLAWIPLLLGSAVARLTSAPLRLLVAAMWLLFLPNAPYLVTDLLHLKPREPVPLWFDAAMLGAFGLAGCVILGASVAEVSSKLRRGEALFGLAIAALCGFGIVLGRFEGRFNSWDVLLRPTSLTVWVAERVTDPLVHSRTWLATAVYAVICAASIRAVAALRRADVA